MRVSDLQEVFAGLGSGFAHHLPAKSQLGWGVDTAKKLINKPYNTTERYLGRTTDQMYLIMQLNNESILVQAQGQPPTWQVLPQGLFPVPKAPAVGFAGSAPKAGANPV